MSMHTICPAWAKLLLACLFQAAIPAPAAEGEPERLIKELTMLEDADTGLSPMRSGSNFPPVRGQQHLDVWSIYPTVKHATRRQLVRLVELGPAALPTLLNHLDDKTETKLVIKHSELMGVMWHDTEIPAPEDAKDEIQAIQNAGIKPRDLGASTDHISEHHVTTGDVCFVIIGMITNRSYNAVRYQMTACQVINSPTSSPEIAKAVRDMWREPDASQALHERLMRDLARDDPGAATRLLYYFPERSSAKVLSWLDAAIQTDSDDLSRRVSAISWCKEEQVRQAVQNLVQTSEKPYVVESGAPAFESAPLEVTLKLMERWLAAKRGQGVRASVQLLDAALVSRPDAQDYTVDTYVRKASAEALTEALPVFYNLAGPPVANLAPLLSNTREGYGRYLKDGAGVQREPGVEDCIDYRICDNIYEIICRALGDKEATCTGTPGEMDGKIKELRARLKLQASAWPFNQDEIRIRQEHQNAKKNARDRLLAQIQSKAKTNLAVWRLTLLEDGLQPDDWNEAGMHLMDDHPANIATLLANLHLHPSRPFDSLSDEEKVQITQVLARRLAGVLDHAPKNAHPSPEAGKFAGLLCCCPASHAQPALMHLVQTMQAAFRKNGWPKNDALDTTIMLLDALVHSQVSGASEYYLQLVRAATPKRLDGGMDLMAFFRIMTKDPSSPELTKAAEWCFARPKSPWRLSLSSYSDAGSLGSAGLLSVPAFRASVIEAMGHSEVVGELSLREDQADYCQILWKSGGSSGQGLDEEEPAGVKRGQTMPIRRCDAILEGVTHAVFSEVKGPPFHIYWPLKKRDEGIQRWIQFLNAMK